MGRIKEYDPNKTKRRIRRPVVYIVCEGKETEINYFKHFRTRYCLVDVVPVESQHKDAASLVKNAKNAIKPGSFYAKDGDEMWCVFDRDENTDEQLSKAKQNASQSGYRLAYSNPCFELWFLLHFTDHRAYIDNGNAALKLLQSKECLPAYEKSFDVYEIIRPKQLFAIDRAEKRLAELLAEGVEFVSRDSNPCTTVVDLVKRLNMQ